MNNNNNNYARMPDSKKYFLSFWKLCRLCVVVIAAVPRWHTLKLYILHLYCAYTQSNNNKIYKNVEGNVALMKITSV